jgi:hypothetical protein
MGKKPVLGATGGSGAGETPPIAEESMDDRAVALKAIKRPTITTRLAKPRASIVPPSPPG